MTANLVSSTKIRKCMIIGGWKDSRLKYATPKRRKILGFFLRANLTSITDIHRLTFRRMTLSIVYCQQIVSVQHQPTQKLRNPMHRQLRPSNTCVACSGEPPRLRAWLSSVSTRMRHGIYRSHDGIEGARVTKVVGLITTQQSDPGSCKSR